MSVDEREHLVLVLKEQMLATWTRPQQDGENDRHARPLVGEAVDAD